MPPTIVTNYYIGWLNGFFGRYPATQFESLLTIRNRFERSAQLILPEDCQVGDLVGIFSTDGTTFRGQLRVRECIPGYIAFDGVLPPGTTQGDILCLIRRGDAMDVRHAAINNMDMELGAAHDQLRSLGVDLMNARNEQNALRNEIARLRAENTRIERQQRQITVIGGDMRLSDLLRRYRQNHLDGNGCTPETPFRTDDRCSICVDYDNLIIQVERPPEPEVDLPVRRIKSSQ